jgi:hypothetical protein
MDPNIIHEEIQMAVPFLPVAVLIAGAIQGIGGYFAARATAKKQEETAKWSYNRGAAALAETEIYNRGQAARRAAQLNPYAMGGAMHFQDLMRGTQMKGAPVQEIPEIVTAAYDPTAKSFEESITVQGQDDTMGQFSNTYRPTGSQVGRG